jgi:hypothetical protein
MTLNRRELTHKGESMKDRFAHVGWIAAGEMALIILSYVMTCSYVRTKRQSSYDSVKIGDTAEFVIGQLGIPSVRETPENQFLRYASKKCQMPCVERLWFENRLALDIEAWSVSLGNHGRVVEKYHWVSP